jgi:hypothetical protein
VLSCVLASISMLFWAIFLLPFFEHGVPCQLVLFDLFYNFFLQSNLLSYSYVSNSIVSWYSRGFFQGIRLCSFNPFSSIKLK